jgi:spermidine/putrescine transport system substrate-binding protein
MRPVLAALLLALLLPGCSSKEPDRQVLNLYIWSEYIDPEIVEDFERQTGIDVRVGLYETNDEMIAKLQQGGGISQYDVVVPSNNVVTEMVQLGLLQQLDHAKLPNLGNIKPRFRDPLFDPGNRYTVPYQWGTVGLLYRKDAVGDLEPSWSTILDPRKVPGRFVLIDEIRDMLGIALKSQGYAVNSRSPDEVRRAGEMVLEAKKSERFVGFDGGVGGKNKVLSRVADLAIVYNGDALRAMEEDPDVAFLVPHEGSILWLDTLAVPRQAPNPEAAHKFVNYLLSGPVGAKLSAYTRYASPNAAALALIDKADLNNAAIYPSETVMEQLEYLDHLGDAARLYDEVWTAVKSR